MNTSLGCPFSCHYCCINSVFGQPRARYWSLEKVLSWLDLLADKGVRNIRFDDELFILSPKRVERFCDMVIERNRDLNFWVYARPDTVPTSLLKKMKKAGVNWICLGIESGNKAVRDDVNKKIKGDIKSVVRAMQQQDIFVLGNYMFGLPEDTLETMEDTLRLAMDLNCEFSNFYTVMALPGSRLYDLASQQTGGLPENWNAFSQLSRDTQPMSTTHLAPAKVLEFRDEAFYRYLENDQYQRMVRARFGEKTLAHIQGMLDVKIERELTA